MSVAAGASKRVSKFFSALGSGSFEILAHLGNSSRIGNQ